MEQIRGSKFLLFLKDFQSQSHFLLFLSTGLYLFCIAFFIQYLINFSIGLPLITFYPLVTSLLLNLLNIIAWCCTILGIIPILFPVIKQKIHENKSFSWIFTLILEIVAVWTMLFVPIGTFLGMGVFNELRKINNRIEKTSNREWFLLLFLAGIIHAIFGGLIIFFFPLVFFEEISLLFPYLNYELLTFLIIIGAISFISGFLLTACSLWSLWSKKFNRSRTINKRNSRAKPLNQIIFISSILMTFVFPIGTFFGFTIFQQLYRLNYKKAITYQEN